MARVAQQHLPQRSPAAGDVVASMAGGRSNGKTQGEQPAFGLAPLTSAQQPAASGNVYGPTSNAVAGASAMVAAQSTPAAMDVMMPGEGRTLGQHEQPAIAPAPSTPSAPIPTYVYGPASSAAASASAPAAAKTAAKYKRPMAPEPKGAASDAKVLYTSRSGGTPFGLVGVPGEQWVGGK